MANVWRCRLCGKVFGMGGKRVIHAPETCNHFCATSDLPKIDTGIQAFKPLGVADLVGWIEPETKYTLGTEKVT